MSTGMTAYIEYDRMPDVCLDHTEMPAPFSEESGVPNSVSERGGIHTSGDYVFFAAVAGVRNESNIEPLFPPRGLPPNISPEVEEALDSHRELGDHDTSWLRLSEIKAALDHQRVDREMLSFETHTMLCIMESLVARLGDERARLVFGFSS